MMSNWFLCCQHAYTLSLNAILLEMFAASLFQFNRFHFYFIIHVFFLCVCFFYFFSNIFPSCIHMSALFSFAVVVVVVFVVNSMLSHLLHAISAFVLSWSETNHTKPNQNPAKSQRWIVPCENFLSKSFVIMCRIFAISEKNFRKNVETDPRLCSKNQEVLL